MTGVHTIFDDALFALLLAVPLIEWKWSWPRYLARLRTGAPGVRARFYRSLMMEEWIVAAYLASYWAMKARPWQFLFLAGSATPLRLGIPPGLRLWAGMALVVLLAGWMVAQRRAVEARPKLLERIRPKLEYAEPLLPHTAPERKLFWLVSLTAGVTEEFLYRGFLFWFLSAWMGPWWAALLSAAIFGAGHVYMGYLQVPRTAVFGLVASFVALASASLWPAMLLHAFIDWNSGELAFRALQQAGSTSSNR